MRARRGAAASALMAALVLVVGACGVPSSDGPQPLPPELEAIGPQPPSTQLSTEPAATARVGVAWIKDKHLRLVPRAVVAQGRQGRVDSALTALIGGPESSEQARGFTSLIPPDAVLDPQLVGHRAVVDVSLISVQPSKLSLAIGQIALTVLNIRGVQSVTFTVDGSPVSVPLLHGQKSDGPVTALDYAKPPPKPSDKAPKQTSKK